MLPQSQKDSSIKSPDHLQEGLPIDFMFHERDEGKELLQDPIKYALNILGNSGMNVGDFMEALSEIPRFRYGRTENQSKWIQRVISMLVVGISVAGNIPYWNKGKKGAPDLFFGRNHIDLGFLNDPDTTAFACYFLNFTLGIGFMQEGIDQICRDMWDVFRNGRLTIGDRVYKGITLPIKFFVGVTSAVVLALLAGKPNAIFFFSLANNAFINFSGTSQSIDMLSTIGKEVALMTGCTRQTYDHRQQGYAQQELTERLDHLISKTETGQFFQPIGDLSRFCQSGIEAVQLPGERMFPEQFSGISGEDVLSCSQIFIDNFAHLWGEHVNNPKSLGKAQLISTMMKGGVLGFVPIGYWAYMLNSEAHAQDVLGMPAWTGAFCAWVFIATVMFTGSKSIDRLNNTVLNFFRDLLRAGCKNTFKWRGLITVGLLGIAGAPLALLSASTCISLLADAGWLDKALFYFATQIENAWFNISASPKLLTDGFGFIDECREAPEQRNVRESLIALRDAVKTTSSSNGSFLHQFLELAGGLLGLIRELLPLNDLERANVSFFDGDSSSVPSIQDRDSSSSSSSRWCFFWSRSSSNTTTASTGSRVPLLGQEGDEQVSSGSHSGSCPCLIL